MMNPITRTRQPRRRKLPACRPAGLAGNSLQAGSLWLRVGGIALIFSFDPSLHAQSFKKIYSELEQAEQQSPPPLFYHQKPVPVEPEMMATATPAEVELKRSAETILKIQEMWSQKVAAQPTASLFYNFTTEQAQAARNLARSEDDLDKTLAQPVTLDLLLPIAFERNPMIAEKRRAWKAAIEQYPQTVYLDNVLQQYNAFTRQLETKVGMEPQRTLMTFQFPFPGLLALKGEVISAEVRIREKAYEIAVRDMVSEMRMAWHDYFFVQHSIEINQDTQNLLRDLEGVARKKYEAGKAELNDVIKAQVELSRLSNDLITVEEEFKTAIARLNSLMNRAPDAPLGAPQDAGDQELKLPLDQLYPLSLKEEQELRMIELEIEKMELMIRMSAKMTFPDPTRGASYFEDRSGLLVGPPREMATFKRDPMPMPRFWFGSDDAYLRELKEDVGAMKEKLRSKQDLLHFEIKRSHYTLDASQRQRDLYQTNLIPQAKKALEASRTAYIAGKVNFLSLLDAERVLLEFNLNYHDSIREVRMNLARLERAIGKRIVP